MEKDVTPYSMDQILVKHLLICHTLGANQWEIRSKQPLLFTITAFTTVRDDDVLTNSVNYASLAESAQKFTENSDCDTMEILAESMSRYLLHEFNLKKIKMSIEKSKGLLHGSSVGIEITRTTDDLLDINESDLMFLNDLSANCIIGIHPWERVERQKVIFNIKMFPYFTNGLMDIKRNDNLQNYRTITRKIISFVELSSYRTVEALALNVCHLIDSCGIPKVTVELTKPSAITFASGAGIEVTRNVSVYR